MFEREKNNYVEKLYYYIKDVSVIKGLTLDTLKGRRKRGTIKYIKEGCVSLMPKDDLAELLKKLDRLRTVQPTKNNVIEKMTPYYWKTTEEKLAQIESSNDIKITYGFNISFFNDKIFKSILNKTPSVSFLKQLETLLISSNH